MAGVLDLFKLDGKAAIVTGSERGLGQAYAVALAEAGADVLGVTYADEASETAASVRAAGRRYVHMKADLMSLEPIPAVVERAVAEFGRDEKFLEALHIDFLGIEPLDAWKVIARKNASTCPAQTARSISREFM